MTTEWTPRVWEWVRVPSDDHPRGYWVHQVLKISGDEVVLTGGFRKSIDNVRRHEGESA